jgi:hypothetical protein
VERLDRPAIPARPDTARLDQTKPKIITTVVLRIQVKTPAATPFGVTVLAPVRPGDLITGTAAA